MLQSLPGTKNTDDEVGLECLLSYNEVSRLRIAHAYIFYRRQARKADPHAGGVQLD